MPFLCPLPIPLPILCRIQILAGADIHAAKDLARVGRNDLAAQFTGQIYGQAGLARSGRAEDGQEVEGEGDCHNEGIVADFGRPAKQ